MRLYNQSANKGGIAVKQILSVLMTFVLLLTGGGGQAGGKAPEGGGNARTLAQPVYPKFPVYPEEPGEGESWEEFFQAQSAYYDALRALRGGGVETAAQAHLNDFAGRSTALALAGHEGENAVYSPLSLWSALAMLGQCAQGDSRRQVLDALGVDSVDGLQEEVAQVWRGLYTDDGQSSLILANSIWLNNALGGCYVQETLDTLSQKYYAGAYAVPMGTEEADRAVSGWVKEQTNGLIGGDQPVVRTKAETLALLASSLYYRAGWTDEFNADQTEEDTFTAAAGQESRVDFMHRTERASFLRRKGYQAASLGTRLGEMVFVLPDEGVSPESLLQDPDFLAGLDIRGRDSRSGEVQWSVPKFDVDSDLGLLDTLSALGIADLLNPDRADLSALTDLDAYVSDAKQLARVKVDEEGVEAAAVTIITMDCTSAMPPMDPEICVMDLDRPFLFVIRTEDIPLFIGVVNQVQA